VSDTKLCTKCGEKKPVGEFWRNSAKPDGLFQWCKPCARARKEAWRKANPEKVATAARRFKERHPERQRAWHKQWRDKNPDKAREYTRRHREKIGLAHHAERAWARRIAAEYGMTPEDYLSLFDAQKGRCALCGAEPSNRRLCVDHDHKTGQVRGLLCSLCNRTLGMQDDNPAWFRRAASYLAKQRK
jgi:hypothetical protein